MDAEYMPIREEVLPIHGVKVRCAAPNVRRASMHPGDAELPLTPLDGVAEVVVPVLQITFNVVEEFPTNEHADDGFGSTKH